jgi:hypothetical protein
VIVARPKKDVLDIGVRVELKKPDRRSVIQPAQNGETCGVIPADADWGNLVRAKAGHEVPSGSQAGFAIENVDRCIAEIGHICQIKWADPGVRIDAPDAS